MNLYQRYNRLPGHSLGLALIISLTLLLGMGSAAFAASADVAWDPAPGTNPDGYIVCHGTNSGSYELGCQDVGSATQHTLADLNADSTYYMAVRAYDQTSQSAYSDELPIDIPADEPVDPPPATTANATLAWDPAPGTQPDGYILCGGEQSGVYEIGCLDVGNVTQHTLNDLPIGNTYYFAVKAYDQNGESELSEELAYTVINHAPGQPATPTGNGAGVVAVSYSYTTSAQDVDGHTVAYRFDWGDGSISDWGEATQSHNWSQNGDYCVKAQAQDSVSDTSAWSACLTVAISTPSHTITASAGVNGSITPSGAVSVANGGNQTFNFSPADNYHVADVRVDGTSIGAPASYSFSNVSADHTIVVDFALNQYLLTASSGANGTIAPEGTITIPHGASQTFAFTPAAHHHVADVLVDGVSVGASGSYTLTNITAAHSIQVSFAANQYTLTASSGANGSITPSGAVYQSYGRSQSFTFTPDAHHHIADVQVDGVSVGTPASYTFDNIAADHTIAVSYAPNTYMVTVNTGDHGSVSPNGMIQATYGETIDFTFTADSGYHIEDVTVDGTSVGAVASYRLQNISGDHAITVVFAFNLNPPLNLHVSE
jgi:hypothetical protein